MSLLPALASRQYPASTSSATRQADGGAGTAASAASAASALMARGASDAVSLSQNGIDLSAQGMAARATDLGNTTVDAAQSFLGTFAQHLFGDAAKGATISFDSASLSANSSFAAGVQHSAGPDGSSDSAAFSLNESSHFIGKGKITTADGQSFEFEIEVQYESSLQAAATQTGAADSTDSASPDDSALPTKKLPDMRFPGSLDDLFKLLGRQMQSDIMAQQSAGSDDKTDQTGTGGDKAGSLSLRLLKLINNPVTLDGGAGASATPEQSEAAARAKALANAYGTPAPADAAPANPAPVNAAQANAAATDAAATDVAPAAVTPEASDANTAAAA